MLQKKCPAIVKQGTMTIARGSLTAPLACALSEQETTIRARNKNSCSFLNPSQSPFPGMGYFLISCLKKCSFFDEIWNKKDKSSQMFFLMVPFQRLVIWHALGQGPANLQGRALWEFDCKCLVLCCLTMVRAFNSIIFSLVARVKIGCVSL